LLGSQTAPRSTQLGVAEFASIFQSTRELEPAAAMAEAALSARAWN
jgi:hypothetical protein